MTLDALLRHLKDMINRELEKIPGFDIRQHGVQIANIPVYGKDHMPRQVTNHLILSLASFRMKGSTPGGRSQTGFRTEGRKNGGDDPAFPATAHLVLMADFEDIQYLFGLGALEKATGFLQRYPENEIMLMEDKFTITLSPDPGAGPESGKMASAYSGKMLPAVGFTVHLNRQ